MDSSPLINWLAFNPSIFSKVEKQHFSTFPQLAFCLLGVKVSPFIANEAQERKQLKLNKEGLASHNRMTEERGDIICQNWAKLGHMQY